MTSAPHSPGTAAGFLQRSCPDLTYFLMANTVSPMVVLSNCASRMAESKTPSQMMGANQGVMTSTSALLRETSHTVLEQGVDIWAVEGKDLSKFHSLGAAEREAGRIPDLQS